MKFLPSWRESILLSIIIVLIGVVAYGTLWFNDKYVLMPIEREKVENVENCINNDVACSLIYNSTEEIPSE